MEIQCTATNFIDINAFGLIVSQAYPFIFALPILRFVTYRTSLVSAKLDGRVESQGFSGLAIGTAAALLEFVDFLVSI